MNVLFVCSRNRLRSPTAENIFRDWPGIRVASAGLAPDADEILTAEDLDWADVVIAMEKKHKAEISRRFMPQLRDTRVVALAIRDDYGFMDPELIEILRAKVSPAPSAPLMPVALAAVRGDNAERSGRQHIAPWRRPERDVSAR